MVLVTGPTGSGKTTTLYAALSEIKSIEDKIITIEDPVEYQLRGITQIPINEKKGLTFARGLRSILRHDPDKIMVGEIRDNETAQIAINSALTGHLVFTTVHANNVLDVLGRFLNMGVEAVSVRVGAQLRAGAAARPHHLHALQASGEGLARCCSRSRASIRRSPTHTFYEGIGCIECNGTGYKGRMAICELLDLTDRIREMILEKRPTSEIKKAARDEGMRFLRESAVERVMDGRHDAPRDQQGDVRRMSLFSDWTSLRDAPPPGVAVEIAAQRVSAASLEMRGGRPVVAAHAVEPLPDGRARALADGRQHRTTGRRSLAALGRVLERVGPPAPDRARSFPIRSRRCRSCASSRCPRARRIWIS